jgi:Pyridoxamine 5'-phosphate oxidase
VEAQEVSRVMLDPVARELLDSPIPARLAYTGRDGFPRAIPIAYHWDGEAFVVCTVPHAPKVAALRANARVALTVDTVDWPPHILLARGEASIDVVDGVPDEFFAGARKTVSDEDWDGYVAQVQGMYKQMARIRIIPTWAKVIDFETRLPSPIEALLREQA